MQVPITARTIADLDAGNAGAIIDAAIREAINDLDDRGNDDGKPRQVEIKITFDLADNGQVIASVEASPRIPRRRTHSTFGRLHVNGREAQVHFQTLDPKDPDQRTIDELEGDRRPPRGVDE